MWLVIELVRDIIPIHSLTKFGDDWTKASKVRADNILDAARPYAAGKTIIRSGV